MKTLGILALLAFAAPAAALEFKTLESPGVEMFYSSRAYVASSHTVTGYLASWSIKITGGTGEFEVKHSTIAGGNPNVNLSSTVYVASGETISAGAKGAVVNPLIWVKTLDAGATAYIDIQYLKRRAPGVF